MWEGKGREAKEGEGKGKGKEEGNNRWGNSDENSEFRVICWKLELETLFNQDRDTDHTASVVCLSVCQVWLTTSRGIIRLFLLDQVSTDQQLDLMSTETLLYSTLFYVLYSTPMVSEYHFGMITIDFRKN